MKSKGVNSWCACPLDTHTPYPGSERACTPRDSVGPLVRRIFTGMLGSLVLIASGPLWAARPSYYNWTRVSPIRTRGVVVRGWAPPLRGAREFSADCLRWTRTMATRAPLESGSWSGLWCHSAGLGLPLRGANHLLTPARPPLFPSKPCSCRPQGDQAGARGWRWEATWAMEANHPTAGTRGTIAYPPPPLAAGRGCPESKAAPLGSSPPARAKESSEPTRTTWVRVRWHRRRPRSRG